MNKAEDAAETLKDKAPLKVKVDVKIKIRQRKNGFDDILSGIPLNEDGMYVALAYHRNIDFPWEEPEPDYWVMDCLNESLQQLKDVEDKIEDSFRRTICKDISRIVEKAIINGKTVLLRITL